MSFPRLRLDLVNVGTWFMRPSEPDVVHPSTYEPCRYTGPWIRLVHLARRDEFSRSVLSTESPVLRLHCLKAQEVALDHYRATVYVAEHDQERFDQDVALFGMVSRLLGFIDTHWVPRPLLGWWLARRW
jgi:hypothetical protein